MSGRFDGFKAGDVVELDPGQSWPEGIAAPGLVAFKPADRFYFVESAEPTRLNVRPATAAEIAARVKS